MNHVLKCLMLVLILSCFAAPAIAGVCSTFPETEGIPTETINKWCQMYDGAKGQEGQCNSVHHDIEEEMKAIYADRTSQCSQSYPDDPGELQKCLEKCERTKKKVLDWNDVILLLDCTN